MLGGLYGDLPPPSSADEDNKPTNSTVWSSSTKMAPQTLRKPSSIFAAPQTILKSQPKPKPTAAKIAASPVAAPVIHSDAVQTALVGVTSTVLEEYDPARPNDYEEYRRERKKKAMEAEVRRELDRRRMEEEEKERREREEREIERVRERERERERDRDRERDDSRLNISGEEAWRRRAAMSGSAAVPVAPRSPSPPSNADGFMIGKSESGGLGVGAGGQMTAAQRMMAKMGWKQGQGITTPLMAKKTDRRAGVIVNASETKPEKKAKGVNLNGPPTRVLLLRNMVCVWFTVDGVCICLKKW